MSRKYRRIIINRYGGARHESNKLAVATSLVVSSAITLVFLYFLTRYFKH